jgi:hypothetical protein
MDMRAFVSAVMAVLFFLCLNCFAYSQMPMEHASKSCHESEKEKGNGDHQSRNCCLDALMLERLSKSKSLNFDLPPAAISPTIGVDDFRVATLLNDNLSTPRLMLSRSPVMRL